jgi:hypothetical protein
LQPVTDVYNYTLGQVYNESPKWRRQITSTHCLHHDYKEANEGLRHNNNASHSPHSRVAKKTLQCFIIIGFTRHFDIPEGAQIRQNPMVLSTHYKMCSNICTSGANPHHKICALQIPNSQTMYQWLALQTKWSIAKNLKG